ncbi:MAG TPA: PIN domain-containing protein [Pontimonas sp.]|nr:PIN domain-containing protein [Pontimonas sp.]
MAGVIILDSSVLIGFMDEQDSQHQASKDLLEEHFLEGFGVSALSVAEALVYPAKSGREDHAYSSLRRLGIKSIGVGPEGGIDIARLRSRHSIRMPDAVVLHCALTTGSRLATFDKALRLAASEAGLDTVPMPSAPPDRAVNTR